MSNFFIAKDLQKNRKKLGFYDNPNAGEILKIGKEINKMVNHGEAHRINKEFHADAAKLMTPKYKPTDAKDVAREIVNELKKQKKAR